MLYRIDIDNKKLIKLSPTKFSTHKLKERYDIQEWIEKNPEILSEGLLIISKELVLPSNIRLDLLAIDKNANIVIIELKRDESGSNVEWQAIKYTSYCSNFLPEEIFKIYAKYLKTDKDDARKRIEEFVNDDFDKLNDKQRIILVSKKFHSDVISAVLWLRDYEIDIECVRLDLYLGEKDQLFIRPDLIIPLPEAKDYITKKEIKQKALKRSISCSFSLEKGNFTDDDLKSKFIDTLTKESPQTPRLITFLGILLSEERVFKRDEVKNKMYNQGIGDTSSQTGIHLSNISSFLTLSYNSHLRQVIGFSLQGDRKDNYEIFPQYFDIIKTLLEEIKTCSDDEDKE